MLGLKTIEFWMKKSYEIIRFRLKNFILDPLNLVLKHNSFIFHYDYFHQIFGRAMSTNVMSTFATLVIGYLKG